MSQSTEGVLPHPRSAQAEASCVVRSISQEPLCHLYLAVWFYIQLVGCSLWFCFALVANRCAEPGIFLSFTCWNRKPRPVETNLKLEFRSGDLKTLPGFSLPVPRCNFCAFWGRSFQFFQNEEVAAFNKVRWNIYHVSSSKYESQPSKCAQLIVPLTFTRKHWLRLFFDTS